MVYLKVLFVAFLITIPFATLAFVILQIFELFNSHKAVKATEDWCEAQDELKKWYFGSCEKCPEKIKELHNKEEKEYQEFLKTHSFLKPR